MVDPGQSLLDHLNKQQQARRLASVKGQVPIGGGRVLPGGKVVPPGPPPSAPPKGGGGGFLHDIGSLGHTIVHAGTSGEKWTQGKMDLASHDIQAMPAGIWQGISAVGHDSAKAQMALEHKMGLHLPESSYDRRAAATPWETPALGKAMAKQTWGSIRHPGRDPFQTLLTAGMIASAGLGAGARVGAAGDAFSAADEAGVAGRAGAAAKALAKKPVMPNRIIKVPTLQGNKAGVLDKATHDVQFTAAQRPFARLIQEGHDKLLQRSLDKGTNVGAKETLLKKYADRRVSHAMSEQWRRGENMDVLPQMIHEAGKHFGPGLSRKEGNLAIGLRSAQVLPHELKTRLDEVAHEHPGNYDSNQKLAALARSLHEKNVLIQNKAGKVVINKKLYPQLAKADKLAKLGQVARNKVLLDYGLMTPEAMHQREALIAEVARSEAARGEDGLRHGDGYFNLQLSRKKMARFPRPAAATSGVIGKPLASFIDKHGATGEGVLKGLVPDDIMSGIARSVKEASSYKQKMIARDQLHSIGSDVSLHPNDVAVRDPKVVAQQMSTRTKQAVGQEHSTLDTIDGHEHNILDNFKSYMNDVMNPRQAGSVGIREPGVRWVPEHQVGDLGRSAAPRGPLSKKMDAVNSAITSGTVYAKPSHVPQRYVTDATTSLLSGALTSPATHAYLKSLKGVLSEKQLVEANQAGGLHGYLALPHEGESWAAKAASWGANFFANHIDAKFRLMNLAHEARKAGIPPEEFHKLLKFAADPSKRIKIADAQKYTQVLNRSDRVSMMYDGLTPKERAVVSRAIWFYPWMKAATRYGGHVAAEHPLATAAGIAVGKQGEKFQKHQLGALPGFGFGYIPLDGGKSTSSAGWLEPFNTTGQAIQAVAHPSNIAQNLNPATQAAAALFGLGGGASSGNPLSDIAGPLPEFSIFKDMLNPKYAEKKTHLFPHSPSQDWLTRFFVGPTYPKRTNKKTLHKDARTGGYDIHVYPKKH